MQIKTKNRHEVTIPNKKLLFLYYGLTSFNVKFAIKCIKKKLGNLRHFL